MCYYCPPLAANWCPTLPWAFHGLISFCKEAMAVRLTCDQQLWYGRAASSFKKREQVSCQPVATLYSHYRMIVHGHGSKGYVGFPQWPHDPNLTTNVLLHILRKYLPKLPRMEVSQKSSISSLTTVCERKQEQVLTSSLHFVLTFLALLAEQGFFQEVSYNKA